MAFVKAVEDYRNVSQSGNWVCPSGVFVAKIEVWGGGCAGGSGGGGGGGGGGYSRVNALVVTPGNVYPFSIGEGGQPLGHTAGETNFADVCVATGGDIAQEGRDYGVDLEWAGRGGVGGEGTVGDVKYTGGTGASTGGTYGGGGGSAAGPNGNGNNGVSATGGAQPGPNVLDGGGGGNGGGGTGSDGSMGSYSPGGGGGGGDGGGGFYQGAPGQDGGVRITYMRPSPVPVNAPGVTTTL
jgi:MSHA biogenesis protein MshQ